MGRFSTGELSQTIPLTEPQKEIWTYAQMGPRANRAFNGSISIGLRGRLDVEAFKESFHRVVQRHEALRMTFDPEGGSVSARAGLSLEIPLKDLSQKDPEAKEKELSRIIDEDLELPFDLIKGPLIRAKIVKLSEASHQVIINAHYIICDDWSASVLVTELAEIYSARLQNREPDLPEPDRFSDYVSFLSEPATLEAAQKDEAYWLNQYAVKPPVTDLPIDRPRPAIQTYAARRIDWELPVQLARGLGELAEKAGCTLLDVLFSGFAAYVHRLTGQDDIVIGMPFAGQSVDGRDHLVGHCVNMLPLRLHLTPDLSFRDYLARARTALLDAHDHQRISFGGLVSKIALDRDPSRIPLAPVLFSLDQGVDLAGIKFEGLGNAFFTNHRNSDNSEFRINVSTRSDRIVFECSYNFNLWEQETINRRLEGLGIFLESLAGEPDQRIIHAPLLSSGEKERILILGEGATLETPQDLTVVDLIEEQVRQAPLNEAVWQDGTSLTYGQLNGRANRLARTLIKAGFGPGDLVGICIERCPAMIVGVMGVLKAGAAYVPLDPDVPHQRMTYWIVDSGLSLVLTDSKHRETIEAAVGPEVRIESDWVDSEDEEAENPRRRAGPDDPIYVMYTSGSTGQPKGAMNSHGALAAYVFSLGPIFETNPEDRVLQFTSFWWDPSASDIFTALAGGACLVLRNEEMPSSPQQFFRFCEKNGVTQFMLPTAYFNLLGHELDEIELPERLRLVSSIGEAMGPESTSAWRRKLDPKAKLINIYGPTECAIASAYYEIEDPDRPGTVPIGRPQPNNTLYILDRHLNLCPLGVPGELHIGGPQVGNGYLNRPELTAEQFIPDPFGAGKKGRLYKTGDIFRFGHDGLLEILGRADHQVKIRGFRVELGEIQATLEDHPTVREAVVVVREDVPDNKNLVGYLVPAAGREIKIREIKAFLLERLPVYMIPPDMMVLAKLPLASGGKVDRKALPSPRVKDDKKNLPLPQSPTELLLANLFAEILKLDRVGPDDDFFDLGGNSLLVINVVSWLEKEMGQSIPVTTIFEARTARRLAGVLDHSLDPSGLSFLTKIKPGPAERPFFHIGQQDNLVRTFAGHLDIDNPVYLLHVQPLDGKTPFFTRVDEITDICLEEIRKVQPHGPYLISGYCLGGMVAYEIAQRLRAKGEEIEYLAMIECFLPDSWRPHPEINFTAKIKNMIDFHLGQRSPKNLFSDLLWFGAKCRGAVWFRVCNLAYSIFGKWNRHVPRMFRNEMVALVLAQSGYSPKAYPGPAFIFRATDSKPWLEIEPALGWDRHIKSGVKLVDVPGGHSSIYEEPNVQVFADKVKETLSGVV